MGMTWKFNLTRVVFALAILAAVAMASGANYFGDGYSFSNFFG